MTRREDALLERQVDVLTFLAKLEARFTEITDVFRGLVVNEILWAGVVQLDANGQHTRSFEVPFAALTLANFGAATLVGVTAPPAAQAPGPGPGQVQVRTNTARTKSLAGTILTLYGTPGAMVDLTVHANPQPPAFGVC